MRKVYLLLLSLGLLTNSAFAQTPEKKSVALIDKITGVECYYCGEWGWELADELITSTEGKALYMGVYVEFAGDATFENETSTALAHAFASPNWGIPDFGVNGVGISSQTISSATISGPVNTFAASIPAASPANKMTFNGNTVTASAKVQFWSAVNGEYYLAAYLVEDGVIHSQAGPAGANGPVAHHEVLRGSMSPAKPFGEQIATGAINANQTFDKTFTFNITDNTWKKEKMSVYTVIWKKSGTKYEFVNASKNGDATTPIEEVSNNLNINIFPNPATKSLNLIFDAKKAGNATFSICDITGRELNSVATTLKQGVNQSTLNTSSLVPGTYILNIRTEGGSIQKKFIKE